jgi:hypothetical protein
LLQVVRELLDDWSDGPPANWGNHALPDYLEAFAAWLADSDGHYGKREAPVPWDSWQVVATALQAATAYESLDESRQRLGNGSQPRRRSAGGLSVLVEAVNVAGFLVRR